MDFELKSLLPAEAAALPCDALLVLVPEALAPELAPGSLHELLAAVMRDGDLEPGVGKTLACYRVAGIQASRVLLVRAGDATPAAVRKAVAAGVAQLKQPGVKKIALLLSLIDADGAAVRAAMQACAEASYSYTHTKPSAKARAVQQVLLGVADAARVQADFAFGKALVTGVDLAKEWANRPANHATPSALAQVAIQCGRKAGFKTDVLGLKEVTALGMGALLAVAQGSAQPLRFIVMRYQGAARSSAPVVLVGKGITFDTGGISLKPAAEMDEMKFDMAGAASVLGVFAALAEWRPAINVVGLIPSCENMPDAQAIKPGDVVTSMSGQTIEILNTDAEGRLILCDALSYAARFKPRSLIDVATLTGACVVALGAVRSGLFSAHEELAQALQQAGETALDPCWRLPLDDEYAEALKSNFADLGNVGGRPAGAITAAKFLQKFTADLPWAHLDIAGCAWKSGASKGATGRPVPLLLHYLRDEAARAAAATEPPPAAAGRKRAAKTP